MLVTKPSSKVEKIPDKAVAKSPPKNKTVNKLARLGLRSDMDLVLHLPMRYEDETQIETIRDATQIIGVPVQVEGEITSSEVQYKPRQQLVMTITDETGQLVIRLLHFYASLAKQLIKGVRIRVRGEIRHGFLGAEMVHPTHKVVYEGTPLPTTLTPVYASGEGVSQNALRNAIRGAMTHIDWHDTLPADVLTRLGLPGFAQAVRFLHAPKPGCDERALSERTHPAWVRMKFDELLAQQLSFGRRALERRVLGAPYLGHSGTLTQNFLAALPFTLTAAQLRVLKEIRSDLQQAYPMQRLLQGDVGSGKTIVAALAAAQAIDSGYQVAIMAPTEILAEQHFRKIAGWLVPLGVTVVWLSGGIKKSEKLIAQESIQTGQAQLIIGTHALIQDSVQFAKLGLVIVDEQHRFGVNQRLTLRNKASDNPLTAQTNTFAHQLMMSATPIPRTLAMTYYADLDVSVIDELPAGRTPVITKVVDQRRRDEVVSRVHAAALSGRQIYWVCPLIEESQALQLQTANDTYEALKAALPDISIGLVHGKMRPKEKQEVMDAFVANTIAVLVATTVVEVGVDVPNASLMVIEHAERFGLSQLHQLRGRVGRGVAESVCLLLYQGPLGNIARRRLMLMRDCTDGFEIARQDLAMRGPGEFLGARQSGEAMLRFADLEEDQYLLEQARDYAQQLLHFPDEDSARIIDAHLLRWLGKKEEYLKV